MNKANNNSSNVRNPCFSASNNFDDDAIQDDGVAIDWTPEKGYVNLAVKNKSIPRPAAGNYPNYGVS